MAVVREHFDPVVLPAGFVFNSASTGVRSGPAPLVPEGATARTPPSLVRETTVLYEAQPQEFMRRFEGFKDHAQDIANASPCLDLWIALDIDRQRVRAEFEGFDVRRLLEERTGERAPPLPPGGSQEETIAAYAQATRRLLDQLNA